MTRHGRIVDFESTKSEKLLGIVHILVDGGTSRQAPNVERLRTVQAPEAANPDMIAPGSPLTSRGARRLSILHNVTLAA
jgi:hypothetical protein